jgi:2-polyprenyl-3-methyl-5-hydroxy-6-metoxy-1,4-benzoquinol methylase
MASECKCCGSSSTLEYSKVSGATIDGAKWFQCQDCNSLSANYSYSDVCSVYDEEYIYHLLKHANDDRGFLLSQLGENLRLISVAKQSGKFLDIGCLDGCALQRMRESGFDCYGFDVIPQVKQKAAEWSGVPGDHILIADEYNSTLFDEKFDVIMCREVIEHVERPMRLLDEIRKSLKPGGIAQIQTPQISADGGVWDQQAHIHIYSPHQLRQSIEFVGLAVIDSLSIQWDGGQCWTCRV